MKIPYYKRTLRYRLLPTMLLLCLTLPAGGCSARPSGTELIARQCGHLPTSGTIALRSGLAWTREDSPLFKQLKNELTPRLTAQGLAVVNVPPSAISDVPSHTLSSQPEQDYEQWNAQGPGKSQTTLFALSQEQNKPIFSGSGPIPGRVPQELETDAKHSDFILVCRFATMGRTVFPGKSSTPVATRALVSAPAGAVALFPAETITKRTQNDLNTFVTAAGPIRGVGTLGYGSPAQGVRPHSSYGSSPRDYQRGYEAGPRDPWGREADFSSPGYAERYSTPPQSAQPPQRFPASEPGAPEPGAPGNQDLPTLPKPPLPGDEGVVPGIPSSGGSSFGSPPVSGYGSGRVQRWAPDENGPYTTAEAKTLPAGGGYLVRGTGGEYHHVLEMELYDVRTKGTPRMLWKDDSHLYSQTPELSQALPRLAEAAFAAPPARQGKE